jgi:DNA-directed RNA polymerase sigma subunit (sigma70/sigma32)
LFSGLRISASSQSPSLFESNKSPQHLDADENVDEVEKSGATGFSFINQAADSSNIEEEDAVMTEKRQEEIGENSSTLDETEMKVCRETVVHGVSLLQGQSVLIS